MNVLEILSAIFLALGGIAKIGEKIMDDKIKDKKMSEAVAKEVTRQLSKK